MENRKPVPETVLRCEDCLRDIPPSAALTAEGSDYVGAFCGLECYQKFVAAAAAPAAPATGR
ncbi:MAG: DUF3330 domain-containing protein [Rhodocyclaceae bacterium]|nr:DUF3330 domain-containing protein [Rhodocyclaceae bacterium]